MRRWTNYLQKIKNARSVSEAKQIQAQMVMRGKGGHLNNDDHDDDLCARAKLMGIYAMHAKHEDARLLMDKTATVGMRMRVWNDMMRGYAESGLWEEVVEVFIQMMEEQQGNPFPDTMNTKTKVNFPLVLKACGMLKRVQLATNIHGYILVHGFDSDVSVGNALVAVYSKCGLTDTARHVFDKMPQQNVVSWNSILAGYAQNGKAHKALEIFRLMRAMLESPVIAMDSVTLATLLSACATLRDLEKGKGIHVSSIKSGLHSDAFVGNALLDMYGKCGVLELSCRMFDRLHHTNKVSWNTMIGTYVQNGKGDRALQLCGEMQQAHLKPDAVTAACILPACGLLDRLPQGKEIHAYTIRGGLEAYVFVRNALLDMYAKCGRLEVARQLFDKMPDRDVVSWNTMIAGFAQNGEYEKSVKLFCQIQGVGTKPNSVTLASVLPAFASLGALDQGKAIHNYAIKSGYESKLFAMNALIDMYVKCGCIEDAFQLFETISQRDVVSWNAIIGYTLTGQYRKIFNLSRMRWEGVKPDSITIASLLSGCARVGALQQGKEVHCNLIITGFGFGSGSHVSVGNALIDMYAKCGRLNAAHRVFLEMSHKTVISWNTMIGGYGMHGLGEAALNLFYTMQHQGVKADHITFIAILSACSHAGLVSQALQIFNSMTSGNYDISPCVEHYACIVDLLGRSGCLDDANCLIAKMRVEPDASVWGALLAACKIHGNLVLANYVAKRLFQLEPLNTGNYVLLANMYACSGEWQRSTEIRTIMKNKGLKKSPGYSWIEVKNRVHVFHVGDQLHPQSNEIYANLKRLTMQMETAGYVPDTNFVMFNVEEEEKHHNLLVHSEKLAIVFGLINTFCGTPIRITKNLRMCGDCHNAMNFISKIVCREIIVRDAHRFHYFKDGFCSCGNHW